ncbi:hypothetical protein GCM10010512_43760 [Streptomyces thermoviolaceus subsp. thermoviolaceus]|nr:hypothetical protein GCM10010512_43760 [Streptomyces thermoviolaceus subsp. thermoviolaceus]
MGSSVRAGGAQDESVRPENGIPLAADGDVPRPDAFQQVASGTAAADGERGEQGLPHPDAGDRSCLVVSAEMRPGVPQGEVGVDEDHSEHRVGEHPGRRRDPIRRVPSEAPAATAAYNRKALTSRPPRTVDPSAEA